MNSSIPNGNPGTRFSHTFVASCMHHRRRFPDQSQATCNFACLVSHIFTHFPLPPSFDTFLPLFFSLCVHISFLSLILLISPPPLCPCVTVFVIRCRRARIILRRTHSTGGIEICFLQIDFPLA